LFPKQIILHGTQNSI